MCNRASTVLFLGFHHIHPELDLVSGLDLEGFALLTAPRETVVVDKSTVTAVCILDPDLGGAGELDPGSVILWKYMIIDNVSILCTV